MVLYLSYYTLNPIVGIVLIVYPSFNEYNIVVLPAPSNPSIRILQLRLGIFLSNRDFMKLPIFKDQNVITLKCYNFNFI